MKPYFLSLATVLIVGVGCQLDTANFQGDSIVNQGPYVAPPPNMMARPGPMVDGPGPGVLPMLAPAIPSVLITQTSQVKFLGPPGMHIGWQVANGFAENQIIAPGRYNFIQGSTYRLKLTDFPEGREGLVLYPTLQVYPTQPRTDAFLANSSVPLQLTDEDLDQVQSNNFVTKVIYLPDPANQELAIAGVETLVSTRLDPGVDPIAEADRRGTIMLVLRIGNVDLETPDQVKPAPAPGDGANRNGPGGKLTTVAYAEVADGEKGQYLAPMPIASLAVAGGGVPPAMMMGAPGLPGYPAVNPISGVGGTPVWGMTVTGTPIGLPGPTHLPYGGPAGLQSYTIRNRTNTQLHKPVDHFLLDVKQNPGIKMPPPVKYVQYTENHPVFRGPVVSEGAAAAYCPPGALPPAPAPAP